MAYIALYRKFRPLRFEEVLGQEHITQTIKNQIINKRIGHAYLFSGGRGSGKTSTAKILSRAVNCLSPIDGEPCNECEICKAVLDGSLTDITEMDAASNNSVDNIRDIRDEVAFLPTKAKYRVYIIDEVHMLSTGAFNALLKTLEEPPAHVIFILATTEPQKLPATILSRCQRFDFKRISQSNIIKRLKMICEASQIKIEDNALTMIASLAEGAMRDAISILDRCVSDGDTLITESKIRELAGIPEFEYVIQIVQALIEKNPDQVLQVAEKIIKEGKDVTVFLWEIIKTIRNLLIFYTSGDVELYNEIEKANLKDLIQKTSKEQLIELVTELSDLEASLKWSTQSAIIFEVGLIRICMPKTKVISEEMIEQKKVEESRQKDFSKREENTKTEEEKKESTIVSKETPQKQDDLWKETLAKLKASGKVMLYANLMGAKAKRINELTIGIIFDKVASDFGKAILEKEENKRVLQAILKQITGKEMTIKCIDEASDHSKEDTDISGIDFPVNIME